MQYSDSCTNVYSYKYTTKTGNEAPLAGTTLGVNAKGSYLLLHSIALRTLSHLFPKGSRDYFQD